jgi:hypothetical protein
VDDTSQLRRRQERIDAIWRLLDFNLGGRCPECGVEFKVEWGDKNPDAIVVRHTRPCKFDHVAYCRKHGLSLSPRKPWEGRKPKVKPKPAKKWATREFVLAGLNKAERRVIDMLDADPDRTNREFYDGGVRPGSLTAALRVIEALGLYGVKHNPNKVRKDRYDSNRHWRLEGWQTLLQGTREEAKALISAVAKAVRKGAAISDQAKGEPPDFGSISAYAQRLRFVGALLRKPRPLNERRESQLAGNGVDKRDRGWDRARGGERHPGKPRREEGRPDPMCGLYECYSEKECAHPHDCPLRRKAGL